MSSGTGLWMISLKNFSLNLILLCHNERSSGRRSDPPELSLIGDLRGHEPLAVLVLVDQLDMTLKQPPHLVPQADVDSAVVAVDSQGPHELGEGIPEDEFTALGLDGFGRDPRQHQARQVSEGQLLIRSCEHNQCERPVFADVLFAVAWIRSWQ